MNKTIAEIKMGLRAGDKVWIAEQLPGDLAQNKVTVSILLSYNKIPRRGKRLLAYNLAIKRVEFNERFNKEFETK
jgi:hypothetical protein